jgi:hypothetical protein
MNGLSHKFSIADDGLDGEALTFNALETRDHTGCFSFRLHPFFSVLAPDRISWPDANPPHHIPHFSLVWFGQQDSCLQV